MKITDMFQARPMNNSKEKYCVYFQTDYWGGNVSITTYYVVRQKDNEIIKEFNSLAKAIIASTKLNRKTSICECCGKEIKRGFGKVCEECEKVTQEKLKNLLEEI